MTIKYADLASLSDRLIKLAGTKVTVIRDGASVGTSYGVVVNNRRANDQTSQSSVLAQTTMTTKAILISGLGKTPQVGDQIVTDRETFVAKTVEAVRPSTTTLIYKVEVS